MAEKRDCLGIDFKTLPDVGQKPRDGLSMQLISPKVNQPSLLWKIATFLVNTHPKHNAVQPIGQRKPTLVLTCRQLCTEGIVYIRDGK